MTRSEEKTENLQRRCRPPEDRSAAGGRRPSRAVAPGGSRSTAPAETAATSRRRSRVHSERSAPLPNCRTKNSPYGTLSAMRSRVRIYSRPPRRARKDPLSRFNPVDVSHRLADSSPTSPTTLSARMLAGPRRRRKRRRSSVNRSPEEATAGRPDGRPIERGIQSMRRHVPG